MSKKSTWNQELINKYDNLLDEQNKIIKQILSEKIGERINLGANETIYECTLKSVEDNEFTVELDNGNVDVVPFFDMERTPFFTNNIINLSYF